MVYSYWQQFCLRYIRKDKDGKPFPEPKQSIVGIFLVLSFAFFFAVLLYAIRHHGWHI